LVFIKHPPEGASEPFLGLCDKLVSYCSDTIDEHQLKQIYEEFDSNFFKSSLGETEERHDHPIMPFNLV
jgi:hypothetical protein